MVKGTVNELSPEPGDAVSVQIDGFDVDVGEVSHGNQDQGIRPNPTWTTTSSSSTSNRSVAFGGMSPPAPWLPYPSCGGMVSVRLPPTFMPATPSIPATNHLAGAQAKRERLAAIARAVELLPFVVGPGLVVQPAGVVNGDLPTGDGLVAAAGTSSFMTSSVMFDWPMFADSDPQP